MMTPNEYALYYQNQQLQAQNALMYQQMQMQHMQLMQLDTGKPPLHPSSSTAFKAVDKVQVVEVDSRPTSVVSMASVMSAQTADPVGGGGDCSASASVQSHSHESAAGDGGNCSASVHSHSHESAAGGGGDCSASVHSHFHGPSVRVRCSIKNCHKIFYMKESRLKAIKEKGHEVLCNDCFQPSVPVDCSGCGKSYYMNQDRLNAIQAKGHKVVCNDCFPVLVHCSLKGCDTSFYVNQARLDAIKEKGHEVVCNYCYQPSVACNNCSKPFLSKQQIAWNELQGYHTPKFCKPCKGLHWQKQQEQQHENGRTRNGKRS